MDGIRRAFLAGRWYPAEPALLRAALEVYLEDGVPGNFRGLIAPHAGLRYSGRCAGRGYAALRKQADLVVVLGSHRGPDGPNTVFTAEAWDTPLGPLVTSPLARRLQVELALQEEPVHPSRPDNGVELHLPFVKYLYPDAQLLMLGIAAAPVALDIGKHVGSACRGTSAVFIGSTDLSHYGPAYHFAPRGPGQPGVDFVRHENDRGFIDRVLALDAPGLIEHGVASRSACCPGAAAATITALAAYGHEAQPVLLEHTLSYDVEPHDSFVGYASIVL